MELEEEKEQEEEEEGEEGGDSWDIRRRMKVDAGYKLLSMDRRVRALVKFGVGVESLKFEWSSKGED